MKVNGINVQGHMHTAKSDFQYTMPGFHTKEWESKKPQGLIVYVVILPFGVTGSLLYHIHTPQ